MAVKPLSGTIAGLGVDRVATLLADGVVDGVVDALMKAGFDKRFADALLRSLKEEAEKRDGL
jgi:hypothetical protein